MKRLLGNACSAGYGKGRAIVFKKTQDGVVKSLIKDVPGEIERFRRAQSIYCGRLRALGEKAGAQAGRGVAEIFGAYEGIALDEAFFSGVFKLVETEKVNIEYAIAAECSGLTAHFETMTNVYMKERALDVKNVCGELIAILQDTADAFSGRLKGKSDVVLVAEDFAPTDIINIEKSALRGLVTEHGGATSHLAILAKALGIPVISGAKSAASEIKDGDLLLLDAFSGEILVNPDVGSLRGFLTLKKRFDDKRRVYSEMAHLPSVTRDGFMVGVFINTGDAESVKSFEAKSCDGVGLFRTEFLYMGSTDYPSLEAQFRVYKDMAARAGGKPVMFRTLDIGGDKRPSYMNLPVEENPSMGLRSIRFCLSNRDIFSVQLRAILMASAFGHVEIIFPMIAAKSELIEAKACLEEEKSKLRAGNIPFDEDVRVGIMVETPAAVMLSEELSALCDFFSVGTNDLVQYTNAADRGNERVAYLNDSLCPAVLREIKLVAENAARAGIPWGICGEAAADERLVPLWVALGVSVLSVAPSSVGEVKHLISTLSRDETLPLLRQALACASPGELGELLTVNG